MNTLLILLAAQLSISQQSNQITVDWSGNWILQRTDAIGSPWQVTTNGVQSYSETPTGQSGFFRLASAMTWEVMAAPTLTNVVRIGSTNHYVIARASNNVLTRFELSVPASEPFPTNPIFQIRGGQCRFTDFYGQEFPDPFECRGNYDINKRQYMCLVEVQDPITTPLLIRVVGQDANGVGYVGYAQFTNP